MHTKAELELYTSSGKYCIDGNPIGSGALTFSLPDFKYLLKQWTG